MAKKKYEFITDFYAETVQEITYSSENWMFFLRSACRNFRLPFGTYLYQTIQNKQKYIS